jgi:hypothetical protein
MRLHYAVLCFVYACFISVIFLIVSLLIYVILEVKSRVNQFSHLLHWGEVFTVWAKTCLLLS